MLSSIWVATTTGRPIRRASRTMRFCTSGTSSGGSSTPRSPRATITASDSAHDLVEIVQRLRLFELGHASRRGRPTISRASVTSSGRWTKDRPM